jgi:gp32 DNA binding protein like
MAFQYRPRDAATWDKKANQSSNDFESFIREEFKLFKPKKGNNCVRILPPTFDDADHYGITISAHYNVGPKRATVLCLQGMQNKKCPMCEAAARATKLGDDDEAKELKARKRTLAWLLDRNDEDMGPLLWAMPIQVDANICKISKDRKTGEIYPIDHPDDGYDVYFDVSGEKITTKYDGYQLDRRSSEVKQKYLDYIEDHPLPDTLIWRDYDEIKNLYEGGSDEPEEKPRSRTAASGGNGREPPNGPEETVTRRRASNGHAGAEEDVPKEREPETTRRRPAPSEAAPRTRREEINDEIPWTDDKNTKASPEDEEAPPQSAAQRLRERYRR